MTAGACTFVLRGERVLPDRQNPPRPTALLRPGALCERNERDEQAGRLRLERGQRRRTLVQGGAMARAAQLVGSPHNLPGEVFFFVQSHPSKKIKLCRALICSGRFS